MPFTAEIELVFNCGFCRTAVYKCLCKKSRKCLGKGSLRVVAMINLPKPWDKAQIAQRHRQWKMWVKHKKARYVLYLMWKTALRCCSVETSCSREYILWTGMQFCTHLVWVTLQEGHECIFNVISLDIWYSGVCTKCHLSKLGGLVSIWENFSFTVKLCCLCSCRKHSH